MIDTHSDENDFRNRIREAISLSGQGSYSRRAASPGSIRLFTALSRDLREAIERNPLSESNWRFLSQVEECLLNYSEAQRCLEQAIAIGNNNSKKDKKRMATLATLEREWKNLSLTPTQLKELGEFLSASGVGCDGQSRALTHTEIWIRRECMTNADRVLEAIRSQGAYSDFQVLNNLVYG